MLVDVLPRGIFDIIPMVCWVTFFFVTSFLGRFGKNWFGRFFSGKLLVLGTVQDLKKRHALEYHSILLEWEPLARIFFFFCGGGGVCLLALSPSNLPSYQATNAAFTALRVDGSCMAWGHPQSGGILGQELLEVHGLDNFCWAKSF